MQNEDLKILWSAPDGPGCDGKDKIEDRLVLFSLIYGLKPKSCLEIGVFKGGSTEIIVKALQEHNGKLTSIDPNPQIDSALWGRIKNRCNLIKGFSPKDIPNIKFDFVFIDGDHDAVYEDLKGILPFLLPNSYILLHDCYYKGVIKAVNEVLSEEPDLINCGILTKKTIQIHGHKWLGLQLLRYNVRGDAR